MRLLGETGVLASALLGVIYLGVAADAGEADSFRTLVVSQDGSSEFTSIQAAVDAAGKGDIIRIKAGAYREDVTIHSKEKLRLIGDGKDQVTILGRERVGVFHIGKWPYGASDIEISGLTINEHGGHAMGLFNGRGIVLRDVRINGMVFGQQVREVRMENCIIGGSETTGVQLVDSHAVLVGNLIHHNDHGVTVAGESDVRLERNLIMHNLFGGVVVTDKARAVLVSNTIVKNGGGVSFLGASQGEALGNIVGFNNKGGFVVAPSSQTKLSYNVLYNNGSDYLRAGTPLQPAPELRADSDLVVDPRFVDPGRDDFRLKPDTPLLKVGGFSYLGALAPLAPSP